MVSTVSITDKSMYSCTACPSQNRTCGIAAYGSSDQLQYYVQIDTVTLGLAIYCSHIIDRQITGHVLKRFKAD